MKTVLTSQTILELKYKAILKDFVIVQFTTSERFISFGALFLDQFIAELSARSVLFEKGRSLFTLFTKKQYDKLNLVKELENLSGGDALNFRVMDTFETIEKIPEYLVAQLLLNSIASPKNELLKFNNLTGGLYVFNNSLIESTHAAEDKKLIKKIRAIELRLNKDLSLNFGVRTFSSLLMRQSIDINNDQLRKEAKYTYSYATNTMRRILPGEESIFKASEIFVKRSSGKNSIVPFLNFQNLESFNESKVGILYEILRLIKIKLEDYLLFDFMKNKITQTHRAKRNSGSSVFQSLAENKVKLNIVDYSDEDNFTLQIDEITKTLAKVAPSLVLQRSNTIRSDYFNIKCIHNKDYYKKYELEDEYDSGRYNIQHITVEDFDFKSEPSIKAILKEIAIKNDIKNRHISIVDWQKYGYKKSWLFGIKDEENYFFLTIEPDGALKFTREDNPRLSPFELQRLMNLFDSYKDVEGIILNPQGAINIIQRTNLFTLPELHFIQNQLKAENENIKLNTETVKSCLTELSVKSEDYLQYIESIQNLDSETITKKDVLNMISHRTHKKKVNELIYERTGILMKTYFRDKTRFEILDSNLDIHTYFNEGILHYYVGTIGEGIKTSIAKASVVRKIVNVDDSPLFFSKLLPLMNVDFVKYGDLTVIPFPFKYLREWSQTINNEKVTSI